MIKKFKHFINENLTNSEILNSIIDYFGTTTNLKLAGYILPNGDFLKLSYANTNRDIDHRNIFSTDDDDFYNQILTRFEEKYTDSYGYLDKINIALFELKLISVGQGVIRVGNYPTPTQLDSLYDYFNWSIKTYENVTIHLFTDSDVLNNTFNNTQSALKYIKANKNKLNN